MPLLYTWSYLEVGAVSCKLTFFFLTKPAFRQMSHIKNTVKPSLKLSQILHK